MLSSETNWRRLNKVQFVFSEKKMCGKIQFEWEFIAFSFIASESSPGILSTHSALLMSHSHADNQRFFHSTRFRFVIASAVVRVVLGCGCFVNRVQCSTTHNWMCWSIFCYKHIPIHTHIHTHTHTYIHQHLMYNFQLGTEWNEFHSPVYRFALRLIALNSLTAVAIHLRYVPRVHWKMKMKTKLCVTMTLMRTTITMAMTMQTFILWFHSSAIDVGYVGQMCEIY